MVATACGWCPAISWPVATSRTPPIASSNPRIVCTASGGHANRQAACQSWVSTGPNPMRTAVATCNARRWRQAGSAATDWAQPQRPSGVAAHAHSPAATAAIAAPAAAAAATDSTPTTAAVPAVCTCGHTWYAAASPCNMHPSQAQAVTFWQGEYCILLRGVCLGCLRQLIWGRCIPTLQ